MTSLALYPLLTTALYYLAGRAKVTEWAWSRYPPWLEYFTLCAACSGFWYGAGVAAVFRQDFLGLPGDAVYTPIVTGLCATVWTPPLAFVMVYTWMRLAETDGDDE